LTDGFTSNSSLTLLSADDALVESDPPTRGLILRLCLSFRRKYRLSPAPPEADSPTTAALPPVAAITVDADEDPTEYEDLSGDSSPDERFFRRFLSLDAAPSCWCGPSDESSPSPSLPPANDLHRKKQRKNKVHSRQIYQSIYVNIS
jgi:hypothetical protein